MPRVNLDEEFFVDPRIEKLARLCKEVRALTRGRLIAIYHHCYVTRNPYKTTDEINRYADWDHEESFADLMVKAGLASIVEYQFYRVHGVQKRVAYLKKQSEYGKMSAKIRTIKHGNSQPIPKRWKHETSNQPSSKVPSKDENVPFEPTFEDHRRSFENSLCITSKLPSKNIEPTFECSSNISSNKAQSKAATGPFEGPMSSALTNENSIVRNSLDSEVHTLVEKMSLKKNAEHEMKVRAQAEAIKAGVEIDELRFESAQMGPLKGPTGLEMELEALDYAYSPPRPSSKAEIAEFIQRNKINE